MKVSDAYPSKYLTAEDLKGRAHLVTISHYEMATLGNDSKPKPVLYFQGKEKGLVTNKTNAGRIAYLYGEEMDDWSGAKIILAPELVDFQGRPKMAIRVRAPNGAGPKKPPLQNSENPAAPLEPVKRAAPQQDSDSSGAGFDDDIPFAPEWRG